MLYFEQILDTEKYLQGTHSIELFNTQAQSQLQLNWTDIAFYSLAHFDLQILLQNPTGKSIFLSSFTKEFSKILMGDHKKWLSY